jgi:hypothetical protein
MRRLSKQPAERDLRRGPLRRDGADLLKRQTDLLAGLDRTLLTSTSRPGATATSSAA